MSTVYNLGGRCDLKTNAQGQAVYTGPEAAINLIAKTVPKAANWKMHVPTDNSAQSTLTVEPITEPQHMEIIKDALVRAQKTIDHVLWLINNPPATAQKGV